MTNYSHNKNYLFIELNQELFGIDVERISEVAEVGKITPVPNSAPYVAGIANLRGEVLTVVDLRKKFNLPMRKFAPEDVIVVANFDLFEKKVRLGLRVDKVRIVEEIMFKDITEIPELGTKYNTKYLHGIIAHKNGFVAILNLEKIFSDEEITIISESGIEPAQP